MKKIFTILTVALTMNVFAQIPTNGLTSYWLFTGNANDNSGNGNNGTVTGATLTTDRFGNINSAYNFSGTAQYINTTYSGITGPNDRTFSLWFKQSTLNNGSDEWPLFSYGGVLQGGGFGAMIFPSGNKIGIDIGNSYVTFNSTPTLNQWHHLIVQYSASFGANVLACKIYIDNVLTSGIATQYNSSLALNTGSGTNLFVGGNQNFAPQQFLGAIDDFRVYNTILSPSEISLLYNENNQNVCSSIGQDSTMLFNNGYITGPQASGSYPIHTDSKWVNVTGADSLRVNTLQHRFYDMSKIYDKNNLLIWQWLGESSAPTWYYKNHSVYVGGNDSVRLEFYQGYINFSVGHLQITKMICGNIATNTSYIDNTDELNIYPNPATNHVMIEFGNDNIVSNYILNITNSIGQIVLTTVINNQSTNVNLGNLITNGIYFLHITDTHSNTVAIKKIILQ